MQRVLVINGSPKGERSNTMQLTDAVLCGMKQATDEIEVYMKNVCDMDITPCVGCMSCWGKTPGKCVVGDCMQEVYESFKMADTVIFSFPLYFFGMPGAMKVFVDRLMPLMETYRGAVKTIGNDAFHEFRFDTSDKQFVIISTCGYGRTEEIFDSLTKEMDFIFGGGNYYPLYCPQGEMFAIESLKPQINCYLERYRAIGTCLGAHEVVTEEMLKSASEPIIPQRAFEMLVNNYWNQVTPKKKVYLFGDSLMKGVMPDADGMYHSSDAIGFSDMQERFRFELSNFAMPTFTTAQILTYMKTVAAGKELPDFVILEGGGNDCDHDWPRFAKTNGEELVNRVPLEQFESNIREMVSFWTKKHVPCALVITPPIDMNKFFLHLQKDERLHAVRDKFPDVSRMEQEYVEYKKIMYQVIEEYHLSCIDLSHCFDACDGMDIYSEDGMHPNEIGYGMFKPVLEGCFSRI